jgi:S-methylmethionine-dependent homocysteine/selenocysteine methylase
MATVRKPRLIDEVTDDRIDPPEAMSAAATEAFTQAFTGAGDAARQAVEAGRKFQEDAAQFWRQRLHSNSEAASQFLKCKSMPDVFEAQQAWAKTAAEQYSAYLTHMFETMQSSLTRSGGK